MTSAGATSRVVAERDAWLSGIWGQPVFRVGANPDPGAIRQALASAWSDGPAFCYAKIPTSKVESVAALGAVGFNVVDVSVTFERLPEAVAISVPGVDVGVATPQDKDAVLEIAGQSFVYSRFHLDPRVPAGLADRIKTEWMRNYLNGSRGDAVLVARMSGKPVGFLAILAADVAGRKASIIDLIGVSRSAQRSGVGQALVHAFISRGVGRCDIERVGTQAANIPSMRLYEKCGFRVADTAYVLHGHFDRPLTP